MVFKAGEVNNPNGNSFSKKLQIQLREKLMHLEPEAIAAIKRMLTKPNDSNELKFAVETVIERVYGKVPQNLELESSQENPFSIVVNVIKKE